MTNTSITQSQKRFQESVGALFTDASKGKSPDSIFVKSSSDQGVVRNGGRNGARFAPKALLSSLKRMTRSSEMEALCFCEIEVASAEVEMVNFHEAQFKESLRIRRILTEHATSRIFHIGGGHDHIFPLLKAYAEKSEKIIVINIDAHADTRTDADFHSGTPFRQFSQSFEGEFFLYQIGLHRFANAASTLSVLEKGKQNILWKNELTQKNLDALFGQISSELSSQETVVIFSLDADALTSAAVPAVSAVNPDGLSLEQVSDLWQRYAGLKLTHPRILGLYELNPVYDTVSSTSMKTMAAFLFETLR
jgi:formiminoglutamase